MIDNIARHARAHPFALHVTSAAAGVALAIAGAHAFDSEAVHSLLFWVIV